MLCMNIEFIQLYPTVSYVGILTEPTSRLFYDGDDHKANRQYTKKVQTEKNQKSKSPPPQRTLCDCQTL